MSFSSPLCYDPHLCYPHMSFVLRPSFIKRKVIKYISNRINSSRNSSSSQERQLQVEDEGKACRLLVEMKDDGKWSKCRLYLRFPQDRVSEFRFLWFRNRKNRQLKVVVFTGLEVNWGTYKPYSFTQSTQERNTAWRKSCITENYIEEFTSFLHMNFRGWNNSFLEEKIHLC